MGQIRGLLGRPMLSSGRLTADDDYNIFLKFRHHESVDEDRLA